MFYIRPTLGLADSTPGGVLVVSNTETEKNRNRVLELKTEPNRTGSSNLGTEPALEGHETFGSGGQRSRSHEAKGRFGGLVVASFLTHPVD